MNLQTFELTVPVGLIAIVLALVSNIVVVAGGSSATTRRRAASRAAERAKKPVAVLVDGVADDLAAGPDPLDDEPPGPGRAPAPRGGRLASYATAFTVVAALLLTVYLVARTVKTGHGPFTDQHEFAVSFTWGILVAYLVAEWRLRVRALSLGTLLVAGCLLGYGMTRDSGVEPLVPALQNNLLLTLHVVFAVVAYGAACVSFAAAVTYLAYPRLRWRSLPRRDVFDDVGYKGAVVTFPMLTIMIVLGSVWADVAWGSYWQWDPKETASLVTWLMYGAYLHARVSRGWQGRRAAWLLIAGFAAVAFTYFGNYFLGGAHSYA